MCKLRANSLPPAHSHTSTSTQAHKHQHQHERTHQHEHQPQHPHTHQMPEELHVDPDRVGRAAADPRARADGYPLARRKVDRLGAIVAVVEARVVGAWVERQRTCTWHGGRQTREGVGVTRTRRTTRTRTHRRTEPRDKATETGDRDRERWTETETESDRQTQLDAHTHTHTRMSAERQTP